MEILNDLMNFHSFWTVWFWICHVVAWSMASHFTLGVPYDMVVEANREAGEDGPWDQAAEAMILAQVFRISTYARRFGHVIAGVCAFILSACLTLGTLGDLEFARASLTFFLPLTMVYTFSAVAAREIEAKGLRGAALRRKIRSQRLLNQFIGLFAITFAVVLSINEALRGLPVTGWH